MTKFAHIISPNVLTIFMDGKQFVVTRDDSGKYEEVLALLRQGKNLEAGEMAKPASVKIHEKLSAFQACGLTLSVSHGTLVINGVSHDSDAARFIVDLLEKDLPVNHLIAFLVRLNLNPSFRVRRDLFTWLSEQEMPITDRGTFIAYKTIKKDLWDCHTGKTFYHEIGKPISMPREEVNDDPEQTCSSGAHFAGAQFVYGMANEERVIAVLEVDPLDVVCFPRDYKNGKGRACGYTTISHSSYADFKELHKRYAEKTYVLIGA